MEQNQKIKQKIVLWHSVDYVGGLNTPHHVPEEIQLKLPPDWENAEETKKPLRAGDRWRWPADE